MPIFVEPYFGNKNNQTKQNKFKLKGNIICFGMFHTAIIKPKEKKEVKRKLAKREQ